MYLTLRAAGINVTSYYLPTVLIESVGLSNSLARLLAACNSVSYLLFSLIGIPNVERWGRRKMMMYAAAGQFFCYVIITICIRYNEDLSISYDTRRQWAKGSIAFFFLYYVFFGIGWQGVPWLYPTEINSMAMRTKGAALGTATNWIFNFMGMSKEQCTLVITDMMCSRRGHTTRHRQLALALLHHLDGFQLCLHTNRYRLGLKRLLYLLKSS